MLSTLVAGAVLGAAAIAQPVPPKGAPMTPAEGRAAAVPLGDFAGGLPSELAAQIGNPVADQADTIAQGKRLFIKMNCAGCHNYDGSGGMGPDLTDRYWRYGGTPVALFKSIYEGRPQGMPAWGQALPPDQIWQLVAYVGSFGGTFASHVQQGDTKGMLTAPELEEPSPAALPLNTPQGGGPKP
jgi:cytochrome c oxidase cbb3-type subunit 3